MPDADVDVCRRALESGVAGLVAVAGRGRVGNAPVGPLRVARELGARLAGPVAQGDHVVEPATGEGVEVPGSLVGDVDAERDHAVRAPRWGAGRGLGRLPALVDSRGRRRGGAAVPRRSVNARCCRCTRTARATGRDRRGRTGASAWCRDLRSAGCSAAPLVGQRVGAAVQVEVVVAVPAVEAAATCGDQPAVSQQSQVVGDQVLRFARPAPPARGPGSRCRRARSAAASAPGGPPARRKAVVWMPDPRGPSADNTSNQFDGTGPHSMPGKPPRPIGPPIRGGQLAVSRNPRGVEVSQSAAIRTRRTRSPGGGSH